MKFALIDNIVNTDNDSDGDSPAADWASILNLLTKLLSFVRILPSDLDSHPDGSAYGILPYIPQTLAAGADLLLTYFASGPEKCSWSQYHKPPLIAVPPEQPNVLPCLPLRFASTRAFCRATRPSERMIYSISSSSPPCLLKTVRTHEDLIAAL